LLKRDYLSFQKMAFVPHNVQLSKLQGKVDYLSISLVTAMLCVNPHLRISMQVSGCDFEHFNELDLV